MLKCIARKEGTMPRESEKYQFFTVGLLKSSFALEALKADAMKHHMVEQPAKLIALRLTEYYDLLARVGPPMPNVSLFTTNRPEMGNGSRANSVNGHDVHPDDEIATLPNDEREEVIVTISADAEQNADQAADYWAIL
jgi:hypothetical protein